MRSIRPWQILGALVVLMAGARQSAGHPLGNFSIDHYSRLRVASGALRLRYVIDMAEIPTLQELLDADADRDGRLSDGERQQYLDRKVESYTDRLTALLNGTPLSWHVSYRVLTAPARVVPSAETDPATLRILMDLIAPFDAPLADVNIVRFADGNYPGRTGWKEIVVEGDDSVRLLRSTAPSTDLSLELRRYPPDLAAPPQDVSAEFTFGRGGSRWSMATLARSEGLPIALPVMIAALALIVRWRSGGIRRPNRQLRP